MTLEGDGPEEIERKLLNAEPLEEARENLARMELKEGGVVDSAAIDVRSLGEQTELDMVRVKMSRKRRQHTDSGWESVSLADMDLKFAVRPITLVSFYCLAPFHYSAPFPSHLGLDPPRKNDRHTADTANVPRTGPQASFPAHRRLSARPPPAPARRDRHPRGPPRNPH